MCGRRGVAVILARLVFLLITHSWFRSLGAHNLLRKISFNLAIMKHIEQTTHAICNPCFHFTYFHVFAVNYTTGIPRVRSLHTLRTERRKKLLVNLRSVSIE